MSPACWSSRKTLRGIEVRPETRPRHLGARWSECARAADSGSPRNPWVSWGGEHRSTRISNAYASSADPGSPRNRRFRGLGDGPGTDGPHPGPHEACFVGWIGAIGPVGLFGRTSSAHVIMSDVLKGGVVAAVLGALFLVAGVWVGFSLARTEAGRQAAGDSGTLAPGQTGGPDSAGQAARPHPSFDALQKAVQRLLDDAGASGGVSLIELGSRGPQSWSYQAD